MGLPFSHFLLFGTFSLLGTSLRLIWPSTPRRSSAVSNLTASAFQGALLSNGCSLLASLADSKDVPGSVLVREAASCSKFCRL